MQKPSDSEIARRARDPVHFPFIENAAVTTTSAPRFQVECPSARGSSNSDRARTESSATRVSEGVEENSAYRARQWFNSHVRTDDR